MRDDDVTRPAGVMAGAAGCVALSAFMLWGAASIALSGPSDFETFFAILGAALGALGIATALGLDRMQDWARQLAAALGGLTAGTMLPTALILVFVAQESGVSKYVYASIMLIASAIGGAMFAYFVHSSTVEQFVGSEPTRSEVDSAVGSADAKALPTGTRPMGVTIGAGLCFAVGAKMLWDMLPSLLAQPGIVLTFAGIGVLSVATGIGLYRLQSWARILAALFGLMSIGMNLPFVIGVEELGVRQFPQLAQAAIGAWMVVYFTLRRTASAFGAAPAGRAKQ